MPAIGGARGVVGSAKTGADVTTAGLLVPTVNVEQIIRLNSLDQMSPPAADLNMSGRRLTNVSAPAWSSDGARAFGSLLGYGSNSSGLNLTTASATFAALDTTTLTASFTAISSTVLVELNASAVDLTLAAGFLLFTLFTHGGTTQVTGAVHSIAHSSPNISATASPIPASVVMVVPVTQGTAYQWDWAWCATAGTGSFKTGGATTGVGAVTDFGNATMRVWAA